MINLHPDLGAYGSFERELLGVVCAISDTADWPLDRSITDILRLVREHLARDVVFVARLVNDLNVVTLADAISEEMNLEGFLIPEPRVCANVCSMAACQWFFLTAIRQSFQASCDPACGHFVSCTIESATKPPRCDHL
jgi:hypothetical protein